ncbi:leptin receptor gene-related protein [Uranotaenia lowii]|uniref:leptin receptor gene-related protein n=1 Tax=Uranotaenia lowii TaxID=190385 RepID=UPI00247951A8|nr:leptin receptor gene-related protein [Uranotaenia lowii]XP_055598426.1 leptin receptor gene-related protein [Uranotaenia lowii]
MLAMLGSIGMTMIILACALPAYKVWWPFFVVLFYLITPIPALIGKRNSVDGDRMAAVTNSIFATIGIVISSFALPIVLARSDVIHWGACYLTLAGNCVAYLTILGYFFGYESDDSW